MHRENVTPKPIYGTQDITYNQKLDPPTIMKGEGQPPSHQKDPQEGGSSTDKKSSSQSHQQQLETYQQQYQHHGFQQQNQSQQQLSQPQLHHLNPQTPAQRQYQYNNPGSSASDNVSFSNDVSFSNTGGAGAGVQQTPLGGAGAFGTMTQTPMTGASFGSSASVAGPTPQQTGGGGSGSGVEGILRASNYGQPMSQQQHQNASMDASAGSGSGGGVGMTLPSATGAGLLHGNNPLQPTPVVARGRGHQQPQQMQMQQRGSSQQSSWPQQQQMQQQSMQEKQQQRTKRKHLEPVVEEEDPSMLRYESRPGLDQSPMADRSSKQRGPLSKRGRKSMDAPSTAGASPARSTASAPALQPYQRTSSQASSASTGAGQLQLHQQQQEQMTPSSTASTPSRTSTAGPQLNEFPFFFDGYAAWVCRHCQHIPPYYRGGNYVWQASAPPPNQFVDLHLQFCPGLNPSNLPPPSSQKPPQPSHEQMQQYTQQQQSQQSYPYPMQQTMSQQPQQQQQAQNPFMMQQQRQQQQLQQQTQEEQTMEVIEKRHKEQPKTQESLPASEHSGGQNLSASEHFGGQQQQQTQQEEFGDAAPDPPGMTSPKQPMKSNVKGPDEGGSGGDTSSGSNVLALPAPQQQLHQYPPQWHQHSFMGGMHQPYPYYHPYPQQMMQHHHRPPPTPVGTAPAPSHYQPSMQHLGAAASSMMVPHNTTGVLPAAPQSTTKAKRKSSSATKISPKGRRTDDITYNSAIEFLAKKTIEMARPKVTDSDIGQTLIEESDSDLLTDYFYHMMQQLVVCRFSEKDRKTRGGKRENIHIGYGGLQCIHCITAPTARKFFWSNVDRVANSFAEIPSHVLKCKHCPDNIKDALLALKGRHPDQMQSLPRGSQKVFFRRMWRRLHDGDRMAQQVAAGGSADVTSPVRSQGRSSLGSMAGGRMDPPQSSSAAAAALRSPEIGAPAAANLLAKSMAAQSQEHEDSSGGTGNDNASNQQQQQAMERVLLAIPEDKDWLSDMDCFVRNIIEVFSSKQIDIDHAAADRKYPIRLGQVGIRCIHCAMSSSGARGAAVSYPYSISGIYESVREFQRLHLENCKCLPDDLKETSEKLGSGAASLSSVLRRYYVQAARALGLYDTQDQGISAGGTPVPMSSAGFQPPSGRSRQSLASAMEPPGHPPETESKTKASSSSPAGESKQEDAPGKQEEDTDVKKDAPSKDDTPGKKEDAPGAKAVKEQEDAPGER